MPNQPPEQQSTEGRPHYARLDRQARTVKGVAAALAFALRINGELGERLGDLDSDTAERVGELLALREGRSLDELFYGTCPSCGSHDPWGEKLWNKNGTPGGWSYFGRCPDPFHLRRHAEEADDA